MNVGALKRKVKSLFGDNHGIVIRDTEIIDWINEGLMAIVRETDCLVATSNHVASTFPVEVPNLLKIKRVTYNNVALPFTSINNIDNWSGDSTRQGRPVGYYLSGDEVHLFPDAEGTDTVSVGITYVRAPLELVTSTPDPTSFEIPIAYHEDLVRYVLALAHEKDENWEAMKENQARFAANISQRSFEQHHGNADEGFYVIQDPWDYIDGYH